MNDIVKTAKRMDTAQTAEFFGVSKSTPKARDCALTDSVLARDC
jgi:hypothetical protein